MGEAMALLEKPAFWILFLLLAAIAVVVLVVVLAVRGRGKPAPPATERIPMGWHDDPESPTRLRYHDGTAWTDRTADKT